MPDLWDTTQDNIFNGSSKKSDPAPNGHNDHTKEVTLRDHRGLRPPAYVLIALVIALVAILLLLVGVLFAPD